MKKKNPLIKKLNKPLFIIIGIVLVLSILGLSYLKLTHAAGITKYAVNAGGNWQDNATWSTVAAKDASRVADTVAPTERVGPLYKDKLTKNDKK